jgi:hypothetical protein
MLLEQIFGGSPAAFAPSRGSGSQGVAARPVWAAVRPAQLSARGAASSPMLTTVQPHR